MSKYNHYYRSSYFFPLKFQIFCRVDLYLSGGIHFVSTRILVLDMLKKKIPIEKITGIIILRAHKILESCQESFVLRLYRQNNKVSNFVCSQFC